MSAPPSLLLSHGVIESPDSWGDVLPHLSGRFSILVLDARGRGAWPAPARPFGYPELAADVEELAERRGLDRLLHAGHSMGGRVALEHALGHPGRVLAVAAVSARAEAPDEAGRQRLRAQAERARRLGPGDAVRMWTQPDDAHYTRVREISGRNSAEGTAMALEALARAEPLLPRLGGLRVPALLIAGDGDPSYVRSARLMAEAIPEADVRILPGVGHFPNLECPELLAGLLAEFFVAHST